MALASMLDASLISDTLRSILIHIHWIVSLYNIFLDTLTNVPFLVSQAFTLELTKFPSYRNPSLLGFP